MGVIRYPSLFLFHFAVLDSERQHIMIDCLEMFTQLSFVETDPLLFFNVNVSDLHILTSDTSRE